VAQLFTNFAATTLANPILASDTIINVIDGSSFPVPTGDDFFHMVLATAGQELTREIVRVNSRSGNTLIVVRAQEGTLASAFDADDKAELRDTAAFLQRVSVGVPESNQVHVSDADFAISTVGAMLASYSSITATRTITLPPATIDGQIIMVVDEVGECSDTKRLVVSPSGTDTIEDLGSVSFGFPYAFACFQSNGAGTWLITNTNTRTLYAGMLSQPAITDNGNGTITIGSNGIYSLFSNVEGSGRTKAYVIAGGVFTPSDGVTSYLVADYGSGSPSIYLTTDRSIILETIVIPLLSVFRKGTTLRILNWDELGNAMPNKLHHMQVNTRRFNPEPGGLALGELAGRIITNGAGVVWTGAVDHACAAFNSSIDDAILYSIASGVWSSTTITAYNNTQYNSPTGLASLAPNRYAVNFCYRMVSDVGVDPVVFVVLGSGNYTLSEAQESQPPADLPAEIRSFGILVGRIIVQNGAATATQIDQTLGINFIQGSPTDHNGLSNLDGGEPGFYGHLTEAQAAGLLTDVSVEAPLTGSGTLVDPLGISVATNTEAGTVPVPSPAGGASKFLREDMQWVTPDGGSGDIVSTLVETEVVITAAATLQLNKMHVCAGTTADYTVTLPAASGNAGKIIGVRMSVLLTKYVTIDGNGTELIDGSQTRIMWAGESAILLCDGVGWSKISGKSIPMAGQLYNSALSLFAANTATKIATNSSDWGNLADTTNQRLVVGRTGRYILLQECVMNSTNATATYVEMRIYLNGSWVYNYPYKYTPAQLNNLVNTKVINLAAGTTLETYLYYAYGSFTTSVVLATACVMSLLEQPSW
jgi:hypothetical protein